MKYNAARRGRSRVGGGREHGRHTEQPRVSTNQPEGLLDLCDALFPAQGPAQWARGRLSMSISGHIAPQGSCEMSSTIDAPLEWVETVGNLRLPPRADRRLQMLMDRNNEGLLTEEERGELESLVEMSERLSLVRAEALHLLGRRPK
jgi:hypothetical protein